MDDTKTKQISKLKIIMGSALAVTARAGIETRAFVLQEQAGKPPSMGRSQPHEKEGRSKRRAKVKGLERA